MPLLHILENVGTGPLQSTADLQLLRFGTGCSSALKRGCHAAIATLRNVADRHREIVLISVMVTANRLEQSRFLGHTPTQLYTRTMYLDLCFYYNRTSRPYRVPPRYGTAR
jgi:hypothetical protein